MVTVKDLGPLDWRTPIVDAGGRPSPEFQRQWNRQRGNNGQIGFVATGTGNPTGTPGEGQAYVDIGATPWRFWVGDQGAWTTVGVQDFLDLADVPHAYTSAASKLVRVNPGATGLVFDSLSAVLDGLSTTEGAILYRDSTSWLALAPGTAGKVLQTNGAGAPPTWVTPSAGGGGFPAPFVQDGFAVSASNGTSFTANFAKATAASGNTIFMLVATDGSQTVAAPTGWTKLFDQQQNSFSRLMLLSKATASDTSATFTVSSGTSFAVAYFEMAGSPTLDVFSGAGSANSQFIFPPSFTPTAGALMFAFSCQVASSNSGSNTPSADCVTPLWKTYNLLGGSSQQRLLFGHIGLLAAPGGSVIPPVINNQGQALFGGGGIAYASFSIK